MRHRTRACQWLGALVLALGGCFTDDEGRAPDPNRLYFPTGVVASPGGSVLYVANSDFDLGFSGGSVLALDLAAMRSAVRPIADGLAAGKSGPEACGDASPPRGSNTNTFLNPGPCEAFDVVPLIGASAFVGAFTSGLLLVHEPDGTRARLFAPVRGDPSITYFDVADDRAGGGGFQLDCAQGPDGFCGLDHRLGQDRDRTLRGIQLPADPVGIATTSDGGAIVSAHQTDGAASLVTNDWSTTPQLAYFASNLAEGPTELATIPRPAFTDVAEAQAEAAGRFFQYDEGFVLTFRGSAQLDVLRFMSDGGSAPPRPFLVRSSSITVLSNDAGFDSRGVAVRDRARRACESACGGQSSEDTAEPLECLIGCAEDVPIELFVANRTPETLLIGEVRTLVARQDDASGVPQPTSAVEELIVYDTVPLSFGPSRVELGQIINADGELEDRIFAVCFDSRSLFVYDPRARRVETVIHTGRGPHDIAVDVGMHPDGERYAYLYVGHFTDSYLGVVDLDQRHGAVYGQVFASVGVPTPPQESR